jgi:LPXTG-motif cell wall-anchored protein
MRRCLLILPLLLLTAPAVAHAGGFATTGLSSTPDGLRAGEAWKVELTVLQHGRTPLSELSPEIVTVNADGNRTTFRAKPTGRPGRYAATVRFPKAGQWRYVVYDGFNNAMPTTFPAVVIGPVAASTTTVRRPDPVGPPALPIVVGGALLLGALGLWLTRRRRHPPASLA